VHQHPRLRVVVAVFGEHDVVGQINGGVDGVAVFIQKKNAVAVGTGLADLIKMGLEIADRVGRVGKTVVRDGVEKIYRGPMAVYRRVAGLILVLSTRVSKVSPGKQKGYCISSFALKCASTA